jgi:hypothetical protein
MFNLPYLLKHKGLMQYVVGITWSQFDELLKKFTPVLSRAESVGWPKSPRLRAVGAGRKPHLKSANDKLFFILLYYKVYPTFRFAQVLFGFDKRNVQIWVRRLEQVLSSTLGYELVLHTNRVKINNFDAWIEVCPQLSEFILDCTERPVVRSKDKQIQEFYYSGKKKRHTVKNQILVCPRSKHILDISDTVEGKRHDKKVFEDSWIYTRLPRHAKALGDSGYQGVNHPHLRLTLPEKKPPNQELGDINKQNNTAISKVRVRVEHPLSYLKHFNILAQTFRGRIQRADLPIKTIASIYNFTRTYR